MTASAGLSSAASLWKHQRTRKSGPEGWIFTCHCVKIQFLIQPCNKLAKKKKKKKILDCLVAWPTIRRDTFGFCSIHAMYASSPSREASDWCFSFFSFADFKVHMHTCAHMCTSRWIWRHSQFSSGKLNGVRIGSLRIISSTHWITCCFLNAMVQFSVNHSFCMLRQELTIH